MRSMSRRLLPALVCLWLSACAAIGPPLPPSLELAKAPDDLRSARKGNKVTLTWTIPSRTTDRRSVRYLGNTEICRGLDPVLKQCGKPVGLAAPPADFGSARRTSTKKLTASFVDSLPQTVEQEHPTSFATYAVEVLNTAGRGAGLSNQLHVPLVPTLPPFAEFSAKVTAQGLLITWKCPEDLAAKMQLVTYLFRIYRRSVSDEHDTRVAEIDATQCAVGSGDYGQLASSASLPAPQDNFLDQTFEWEKTYLYRGAVVSVMTVPGKPRVEVEGDDTPEVKVFADDVFPPAVPTGLQAVFSGPGQSPFVDLVWTPDTDADLAGYNVYRREADGDVVKLNSELVKAPAFRDTQIAAGKTYFYSVSAVDQHGNESARSEEANETVP